MSESERKQRGAAKTARIPVKIETTTRPLRKPAWIRARSPSDPAVSRLKDILRENRLHTVCEEASCPNLGECFAGGTATFMIMGDICTRRCPFCDVAHGRPDPLDSEEPENLARTIQAMGLSYVVVTSVDRDDLPDGDDGWLRLEPVGGTRLTIYCAPRDLDEHSGGGGVTPSRSPGISAWNGKARSPGAVKRWKVAGSPASTRLSTWSFIRACRGDITTVSSPRRRCRTRAGS